MPAAAFVPLIIQGAGAAVGAIAKHHAAGQAAKQEVAAGERARADLAPWTTAGGQAASTLASLSGLGPAPGGAPMAPQAQPSQPAVHPLMNTGYRNPNGMMAQPVTGPTSLAAMSQPQNSSSYGGGGVPVRHPQTGQVHMVSPDQVDAALAEGGVRV